MFTSCQAPIADRFCDALVQFMAKRLGVRTEFVKHLQWKERERRFDDGGIDVCWMCGWPYAERADARGQDLGLIAAPVMADPRYLDQPVYFSDVVVRADSRFHTFEHLRGATWAYNEPKSHSGFNVVRFFLATQSLDQRFFGSLVESGSHEASLDLILRGEVDGSAIDSTVLESIRRSRPEIAPLVRVIRAIGPSPAPPWVMRSSLSPELGDALRRAFLTMHESADGRAILDAAAVRRFGAMTDESYDPIRRMAAIGATAQR